MSPVGLLRSPTHTDSAPYASASRAGDLVFTAGACPLADAPGALLGVALLGHPDQLVEVKAVAVRPS